MSKEKSYSHPRWHDNPIPKNMGHDPKMTTDEATEAKKKDAAFIKELEELSINSDK